MPAQTSHKAHHPQPVDGTGPAAHTAGLRADARYNRERILEAARETFAQQGIDAPLSAVARRAGVGVATLYRRFPTRATLVTATFTEQLTLCAEALDEALEDPDPWHGLCRLLEKVCTMQAADRGFAGAFLAQFPHAIDYEHERTSAETGLSRLLQHAKDTGQLRADFDVSDITLLLMANRSFAGQPQEEAVTASRRLLAYFLQSLRPGDHAEPLPPPAPLELHHLHP